MGSEIRPHGTIDEDHVALGEFDGPVIESDLGPLRGDGKRQTDRFEESVRPWPSHHYDDRGIDGAGSGVDPHDTSSGGAQSSHYNAFPQRRSLLLCPLHKGRGRRPGISIAALRLVGCDHEIFDLAPGLELL